MILFSLYSNVSDSNLCLIKHNWFKVSLSSIRLYLSHLHMNSRTICDLRISSSSISITVVMTEFDVVMELLPPLKRRSNIYVNFLWFLIKKTNHELNWEEQRKKIIFEKFYRLFLVSPNKDSVSFLHCLRASNRNYKRMISSHSYSERTFANSLNNRKDL